MLTGDDLIDSDRIGKNLLGCTGASRKLLQDCADGGVFRTFRIESQNDNKIALEIDLSNFSRALRVQMPQHKMPPPTLFVPHVDRAD